MKRMLLSGIIALSTIFGSANVYASEKVSHQDLLKNITIEPHQDQIILKWGDIPNTAQYKVYQGDTELYSGLENSFIHNNLKSGKSYKYKLVAFDSDNSEIISTKLNTETLESEIKNAGLISLSSNDNEINDTVVSTISDGKNIKFDWDDNGQVEEYQIKKNGKIIDTVQTSEYSDELDGGEEKVIYEFLGKIPLDKEEKEKRKEKIQHLLKSGEANDSEMVSKGEELLYNYVSIIKIVEKEKVSPLGISSNNDVDNVKLRYTTFIGDKYVENPVPNWLRLTGDKWERDVEYFGGDNRNFAVAHSRFRTQVNIESDFSDEDTTLSKKVNSSTFYDSNKKLLNTKKAGSSGISLDERVVNMDNIKFDIEHSVGIPYLEGSLKFTPPGIDYAFTASLYREDGDYKIKGWHDGAPSHEFYISFDDGPYEELFQHDLYDFFYLFELTPKHYFNISN
ncbi:DUF3238 domain-containing protein [Brevibacillus laterosporus]|uniref:DUF3238 domain-containing protein n=1 Tax=Brevibacillus laterosporus TaxID=1465 RepID=UPI002E20F75A|nr:DUF3238 domain-containing protein [Brevibacillus laterosporus]